MYSLITASPKHRAEVTDAAYQLLILDELRAKLGADMSGSGRHRAEES